MEIEFENSNELEEIREALNARENILILGLLYANSECTFEEICSSLDIQEKEAIKHLTELKSLFWVSSRKVMAHPFTLEEVYTLSSRGRRYFSALKAIAERELDLQRAILEV